MRIPRWLLPVIAVVAAIAVGVAAVLIAMRFAAPTAASAFVPPATQTSQVLAPVPGAVATTTPPAAPTGGGSTGGSSSGGGGSTGADGSPSHLYDGDDSPQPPASPITGTEEVAASETDPATTDHELLRIIDLIGRDPSLFAGIWNLPHQPLGDPCAATAGTPPADCPTGAPGAIYLDGELPPLWLNPIAFPSTHAVLHDLPTRTLTGLVCNPPATVPDSAVPLRIRSSRPGTWTVRYWPTGHEDQAATMTTPAPTTQQIDRWQTEIARPDHSWIAAEQCMTLPDLTLGVAYTAVVTGDDFLGNPAPASTLLFNSAGHPGHPSLQLRGVGQNILIASAAHTPDEDVLFQAYLIPTDEIDLRQSSCTPPHDAVDFAAATAAHDSPVTAEQRLDLNIADANMQSDYVSYRVPEGSNVLVCARWYPAGDHVTTWQSAQATYQSAGFTQTADRLVPKLELTSFTYRRVHDESLGANLDITASTAQGIGCGSSEFHTNDPVPLTVCAPGSLATGGAVVDGDRLADRGFNGDLVLHIDASTVVGAQTSETTVTLPAGAGACVGDCDVPAPQTFDVATIAGTARFVETWTRGNENFQSEPWVYALITSNPVTYVAPDAPQIDTNTAWTYTPPAFSGVSQASINLPVDRHVRWDLSMPTGSRMNCAPTPALSHESGTSSAGANSIIHIAVPYLCMGSDYYPTLRLTADNGAVSIWTMSSSENRWGVNGMLLPPRMNGTLRYRVDAAGTYNQYLQNFAVWLDGYPVPITNDYANPTGTRCLRNDGLMLSQGSFPVSFGDSATLGLVKRLAPRRYDSPSGACEGYGVDGAITPAVVATMPLSALGTIDGAVLTTPQGDRIHFWFDPRAS